MLNRVITAEVAAGLIRDGDTVIVGGSAGMGVADAVIVALEKRFLDSNSPIALTIIHTTGIGATKSAGLNRLAHKGMIKRVIGGNYGLQLVFMKELITTGEIEAYNFPQGVLCQLYRAMAAKQPGVVTHIGLHTYIDPRQEGGKMNNATTEDLIEVVNLAGDEYLFYDRGNDQVNVLNSTAREIFLLCDGQRTEDEIAESLAEAYDLDPATAGKDTRQTLKRLYDLGVLGS